MNLLVRLNSQLWRRSHRLLRPELSSMNALACSSYSSAPASVKPLPLVHRLSKSVGPSVSIVPVLQQWIDEGNRLNLFDLVNSIRQLRANRRHKHALEILDWMVENNSFKLSSGCAAIRLSLISRIRGTEAAEEYFNEISGSLGDYKIYGALLSCYVHAKELEKAEAIMQKMKDMGFIRHLVVYNEMLNLYSSMGKHEKQEALLNEMEEKGIKFDKKTYTILLHAYVACSNIEAMEKLLSKIELDPYIKMDFFSYSVAATSYMKAGLHDKAMMTLKKSEKSILDNSRKKNYELLIKRYAALGKKDEVYRIWDKYKKMGRLYSTGYRCMIESLLKMDDLDGAELIWKDWESKSTSFEIHIPNLMIYAYSKKGYLEEAEGWIDKIVEHGKEPNALSWEILTAGYLQAGNMIKAVETIKKSILASNPGRIPRFDIMTTCLEYLKGEGDNEGADELLKMINDQSHYETGTSWAHLAAWYLLSGQMAKAVEMVKKAILTSNPEQQIRYDTVATFLKHLKSEGEKGAAEELLNMINQHCHFSSVSYNRLASFVSDEKLETKELLQVEDDDDDEILVNQLNSKLW